MKYFIAFILSVSLIAPLSANDRDDDSVIDALNKETTKQLEQDINMKSFDSCQAFEDVMELYIKDYWENNSGGGF